MCLRHWLLTLLTRLQGVSSLSLNSGSIDLNFDGKTTQDKRFPVVGYKDPNAGFSVFSMTSKTQKEWTLPYLFQSIDTTTGSNKLPVCETALVNALRYTDIGGTQGTHPNFPPFPLCRSIGPAVSPPVKWTKTKRPNPAQAAQGSQIAAGEAYTLAEWVTAEWTATITVPDTLVKTVSSGTMCCPPCNSCLHHAKFKPIVTLRVQIR